jgi:hypothetical protein
MKTLAIVVLILLTATSAGAQEKGFTRPEGNPGPVSTEQTVKRSDYRSRGNLTLGSMVAYGSFSVGGEDRFGPMVIVQYSPRRYSKPAFDFFAGVLIQTGTSGAVDGQDYVPLASYHVPYHSQYSDYRNDNYYRMPHFSIGLAFLGADVTFYLLDGEVRPYVGFGGSLAFWTYTNRLNGTLAPDAKAGLNIHLNNSLSGFAEVRRMFGVPNFLGISTPGFDGLTSAAIGFSFAPRLR